MTPAAPLLAVALLAGPHLDSLPPPKNGKGEMKLTVANVRGDAAVLFTMSADGKLKYVRRVPTGEAVDLDTAEGVRWVAVFAGEVPGSEQVTASARDPKWILRAPE